MATCGYLCPACEGRGYDENGDACKWCSSQLEDKSQIKDQKGNSGNASVKSDITKEDNNSVKGD